ncbi:hypothetical protein QBC35DRAFT_499515 [Podospora australis]|uniref:Uncharacterized protein n=1 Tax=Podospora australis TaxID=1536484 RepID=A0AAN7AH96_9PEZI|nr:hypothetical protein QBC35DRAFT_499515 [Podospora australis]
MTNTRTFFLAPGWEFSAESIALGSIITNPMHPSLALFKATESDFSELSRATMKTEYSNTATEDSDKPVGLFRTFLGLFGLGNEDSFHYDRKRVLSYSFRGMESVSFVPASDLRTKAILETERVAQFCHASDYQASVFMVMGIKTVRGAGVTTGSTKGGAWRVHLSVGLSTDEERTDPTVFAFELDELRLSGTGEVKLLGRGGEETIAELQGRLDRDFGEATFTVIEGFDEGNDAPCKIVASSPAQVDLLTASSARIDTSVLRTFKEGRT